MIDVTKSWKERGGTERAVSPVIGVILMVAIVTILAAVVAVMVMGVAEDSTNEPVNAGASVTFDDDSDSVSVSFVDRADSGSTLKVSATVISGTGSDDSGTISDVGGSYSNSFDDGDRVKVVVTAVNGDRETVIREETGTV